MPGTGSYPDAATLNIIYPGSRIMIAYCEGKAVNWCGATVCSYDTADKFWLLAFDDGDFEEMPEEELANALSRREVHARANALP